MNHQPIERMYYSYQEAADLLGVSYSQIRFWKWTFKKNLSGYKKFTENDIKVLKKIYQYWVVDEYQMKKVKRLLDEATY